MDRGGRAPGRGSPWDGSESLNVVPGFVFPNDPFPFWTLLILMSIRTVPKGKREGLWRRSTIRGFVGIPFRSGSDPIRWIANLVPTLILPFRFDRKREHGERRGWLFSGRGNAREGKTGNRNGTMSRENALPRVLLILSPFSSSVPFLHVPNHTPSSLWGGMRRDAWASWTCFGFARFPRHTPSFSFDNEDNPMERLRRTEHESFCEVVR